jgi:hypothetical protein
VLSVAQFLVLSVAQFLVLSVAQFLVLSVAQFLEDYFDKSQLYNRLPIVKWISLYFAPQLFYLFNRILQYNQVFNRHKTALG